VRNGTGYTEAQIVAGQSNLKHVTSQATAPAGTTFSNGVLAVTAPGTVVDRIWVDGCVIVKASNVTIRNSLIRGVNTNDWKCTGGNQQAGASALNTGNGGGGNGTVANITLMNITVNGQNASGYSGGIADANYTCIRCNVYGFTINMWATSKNTITDSFVHDNNINNGTNHADGIDSDSGVNIVIRHSWVATDATSTWTTGAVNFGGSWGTSHDLTLDNNFLAGITGTDLNVHSSHTNLRITNNAFSNKNGYGGGMFYTSSGALHSSAIWSGNYVPETNALVNRP